MMVLVLLVVVKIMTVGFTNLLYPCVQFITSRGHMGAVCVAGFLRLFFGPKRRGKDDSQLGVL